MGFGTGRAELRSRPVVDQDSRAPSNTLRVAVQTEVG